MVVVIVRVSGSGRVPRLRALIVGVLRWAGISSVLPCLTSDRAASGARRGVGWGRGEQYDRLRKRNAPPEKLARAVRALYHRHGLRICKPDILAAVSRRRHMEEGRPPPKAGQGNAKRRFRRASYRFLEGRKDVVVGVTVAVIAHG